MTSFQAIQGRSAAARSVSARAPHAARIHVLAIGGAHQLAHILPVACELQHRRPGQVTVFVPTEADAGCARDLAASLGKPLPDITVMRLPAALSALPVALHKITRLLLWARKLRAAQVLLCAERTSTILRRIVPGCPPLVHIPHGAGDRAVGFEKRFSLFSHVLVAGGKDRDRLIASGRVPADACTVAGPIKLSALLEAAPSRPPLFANARRTILFNPHFSPAHSSFEPFARRLAEAVVRDGRYNLVIAPHIRMAQHWSEARRQSWEALASPGQVIVDLGSARSNDMTYTLGADLYIGDVSSQVYEFLVRPRPCLFVDSHGVDWRESEDYAMWHFGEVIGPDADPIAAIDRAFADHGAYLGWQKERMAYAIDGIGWLGDGTPVFAGGHAVTKAADRIERIAAPRTAAPLSAAA